MFGEINWTNFDKLVESYAVLSAYTDKEKSIEFEIAAICENLVAKRASLEDFTEILGRKPQEKDEVVRKVSWAAQHILGCRAWSVGQKVLFQRRYEKRWESPLVDQVSRLGYRPSDIDLRQVYNQFPRKVVPQDRLYTLLVDAKEETVHLVKGVSFGQLRRAAKRLELAVSEPNLFTADRKAFLNTTVDSSAVATLLFAREVVIKVFPQLRVRAHLMVLDDPCATWRFQIHDLSQSEVSQLRQGAVTVSSFPVALTHRDFDHIFDLNDDAFATLPSWASADFLNACPVDRPTRCLMLLKEMVDRQERRNVTLARFRPLDLVLAVSETRKIAYPTDLWRHDFEDCLERSRFIERWSDGSSFVLLPKGLARYLLISRKFNPMLTLSSGQLLERVSAHAKLLARTPVL
jgi:hypothetical protein